MQPRSRFVRFDQKRLLGQARHCRDLACAAKDTEAAGLLAALAKSYEAKANTLSAERSHP